jgi:DNA-binding GntR family transcriptional regulator
MTDANSTNDPTKYKRLTAEIRAWLDTGVFQPGEPVPSITDLVTQRGWSRQTCARAMQALAEEGRLKFYVGLGYYVSGSRDK